MTGAHLDDEQLSAHLDGEDGDVADHLDGCARCQARLDELASAAALAGAPVAGPGEAHRHRAVAEALRLWEVERAGGDVEVPPGSRRRMPPLVLAAVAAVALLLVVAVPVLLVVGRGDQGGDAALSARGRSDVGGDAGAGVRAADGGDLGDQSDQATLGRVVGQALAGTGTGTRQAAPPPPPADAGQAAPAFREAAPSTPARGGPDRPPSGTGPPCGDVVRSEFGAGLGGLVYTASLRWRGTPAVALAYAAGETAGTGAGTGPAGRLGHRLFVMSRAGCRLLVFQSL